MNPKFWRVCPLLRLLAAVLIFAIPSGSAARKRAPCAVFITNHGGFSVLGRSSALHF